MGLLNYLIVVVTPPLVLTLCWILRELIRRRSSVIETQATSAGEVAKIDATSAGEVAKIKALQELLTAVGRENAISRGLPPEQIRLPPDEIEQPAAS